MVLKSELERIIENQFQNLAIKEKGIDREKLQKINHKSKMVKIISGIRRCGKSTLLRQIMRTYESYIYLNFEALGLTGFNLNDFYKLDEIIENKGTKNLFFDEIQNVDGWYDISEISMTKVIKYI